MTLTGQVVQWVGQVGVQRLFSGQYPALADHVSGMAKLHSKSSRNGAVGIVTGGMTNSQVAEALGMTSRTIWRWLSRYRSG